MSDMLIPASSVMMLREEKKGFEVFMIKRNRTVDFASNALVFPGGKVDEADKTFPIVKEKTELMPKSMFYMSAIREVFEETGHLLGQATIQKSLWLGYKKELDSKGIDFFDLLKIENRAISFEGLMPFAHWITPEGLAKRFDTHFFVVCLNKDEKPSHDGSETTASLWGSPHKILENKGQFTLIFPTKALLHLLAHISHPKI